MKKKTSVILVLVFCIIFNFVVNAASIKNAVAYFANTKLYINNLKLDKQVAVINNTSYLPVKSLGEALGLNVLWNKDENAIHLNSKTDSELVTENSTLKNEISDLKSKLNSYLSTTPVDLDTYTYIHPLIQTYGSSDVISIFQNNWNKKTPFKVKGKSYQNNAMGISFKSNNTSNTSTSACFNFDNSEGSYSEVTWYSGIDDSSENQYVSALIGTTPSGTNKILTNYDEKYQADTGFTKYTVDVSNLTRLMYIIIPQNLSGQPKVEVDADDNEDPFDVDNEDYTLESYVVLLGVYAK